MAIMASGSPPRDPSQLVPAGAHFAICVFVVDVGIQPGGKFDPQRQVYLGWELPDLGPRKWKDKDGNEHQGPQMIGNFYTLSLGGKAKLRGVLESWRGLQFTEEEVKGFNIAVVLGKPCMLNVMHNTASSGQTYANVNVVMKAQAGPPRKPQSLLVEYSVDTPNQQLFDQLPKFLRDRITNRIKPAAAPAQAAQAAVPAGGFEDDIPF